MDERDGEYVTSNLFVAAYLMTKGIEMMGTAVNKVSRKTAIRFKEDGAGAMELEYFNGGNVPAKTYAENYITIRKKAKGINQ